MKSKYLFRDNGTTECVCDEREGFVFWNETNECYRVYSQVKRILIEGAT